MRHCYLYVWRNPYQCAIAITPYPLPLVTFSPLPFLLTHPPTSLDFDLDREAPAARLFLSPRPRRAPFPLPHTRSRAWSHGELKVVTSSPRVPSPAPISFSLSLPPLITAARPALPSSPTSLLLSRSLSAPDLATHRPRGPRRWVVAAGVPAVAGALAASSAPAGDMLLRDVGATLLVTAGAYSLVHAFDALTERRLVEQSLSRKVVHVLSGVFFMASWPLFSDSAEARFFAALVPFLDWARLQN